MIPSFDKGGDVKSKESSEYASLKKEGVQCKECQKVLSTKWNLQKHIKNVHLKPQNVPAV